MKYEVGDVVRVREDLKAGYDYKLYVTNNMADLAGKLVTICAVDDDYYHIEEDDYNCLWIDDFFEDKEKEKKSDMKLRDFLNNFVDVGKTIIDLHFDHVTFKISVGYNLIEKDTKEWKELIDVFGDKEVYSWNVDIKKDEYSEYPRVEVRCR